MHNIIVLHGRIPLKKHSRQKQIKGARRGRKNSVEENKNKEAMKSLMKKAHQVFTYPVYVPMLCLCFFLPYLESSKGAFGFGDGEFKDEFSKTQSYTDSNMQLDDDLHKNRAKFNRYLEVNNLRYSEAFQSGQKTEKYATDLEKCLADFTDLDVLDENNKFICQNCSSSKYFLIIHVHC